MGECLIARGQTATKNVLDDIPVSGDYCSIVVLLQDSAGGPCENTKINCKDGTRWYNYTTNEAGMVLFKCNSGSANISANNWINGIYTFDQAAVNKDYDAPVGTKRLETLNFGKINHFSKTNAGWFNEGQFRTIDRIKNVLLIGGGGGGGGSYEVNSSFLRMGAGGGGGGGAKNYYDQYLISKNQNYNIYVASGGIGGHGSNYHLDDIVPGNAGGTTIGFGLSANGGSGGYLKGGSGGIGMYNGGKGGDGNKTGWGTLNIIGNNGADGVNGAGGGGGGGGYVVYYPDIDTADKLSKGGVIGGGRGGRSSIDWNMIQATNFGGGGGGAGMYTQTMDAKMGLGGNGYCGKIEFDM